MEKLSAAEQAELKKYATERLVCRVMKAGMTEETVMTMDRTGLLNYVAELKMNPVGATAEVIKPTAVWEQELELRRSELRAKEEERKLEMEFRKAELKLREDEMKSREDDARKQQEFREEEARRQQEFRLAELNHRKQIRDDEKSLLSQTKKYGMAIKNIFPSMPTESAELPSYLDNVDNLFALYEVPNNLRSHLLLSHLTGKAKSIISKLPLDQLCDYQNVRKCLLKEFQVTSRELRSRFQGASKRADESYSVFRGRLEVTLSHYLKSRDADTYDKLIDILTADRLKDTLSPGALRYVLGLEGDDCYSSHKVASTADIYCSNYNVDGTYKADSVTSLSLQGTSANRFNSYKSKSGIATHAGEKAVNANNDDVERKDTAFKSKIVRDFKKGASQPFNKDSNSFVKRACFVCGSEQHLASACPKKAGANSCVSKGDVHSKPSESMSNTEGARPKAINSSVDIAAVNCKRNTIVFGKSTCNELSPGIVNTRQRPMDSDDSDTMCDFECVVDEVPEVHLSTLNYIDVVISGNVYKALIDSGAELPLIKSSLVKDVSSIGNINIQPIVGKAVPANLAVFDVARFDNSVEDCNNMEGDSRNCQRPLHLVFAVTDLTTHDVVLPASVVHELSETLHKSTALCKDYEASIKVCSLNVDTLQTLTKNDNISDDSVNQDIEKMLMLIKC